MEIFSYQGRQVAYIRRGQGTPIVFLHNGGTSHIIWQAQLDALAREHEVWALDLDDCGHLLMMERPDAVTALIQDAARRLGECSRVVAH